MTTLTVLTWNTLFGGRDGSDERRAQAQTQLIREYKPDVFLMQEAKGFEANGGAWLYALEKEISMRGFLARAPRTGQNVAIFIREPLLPVSFEADDAHFHHALATLKVNLPDSNRVITFLSAHLCPNGPHVRLREATYLAVHAAPDRFALLTGDFNSASPHDPEPADWASLPVHHRTRYLAEDLQGIDHKVLAHLEAAGWVDLGHRLDESKVPTVQQPHFKAPNSQRCAVTIFLPHRRWQKGLAPIKSSAPQRRIWHRTITRYWPPSTYESARRTQVLKKDIHD